MVPPSEEPGRQSQPDPQATHHQREPLHREVRFLRELLNAIPDPVFFKDRSFRFRYYNQAFADLFEKSRADILGKTTFELFPHPISHQNKKIDEKLFEQPSTKQCYETTVVRPDGTERQVVIHKAVLGESEQTQGIIGIIADITERKQAEKALRKSQKLLNRVFDAIPDLLSVVDRDLRIQISNWHGGFDYVPEHERAGHPHCYKAYYPEQNGQCDPCHLKEVFRTGKPIIREKVNPKIGTLEIHAFPVFDENNQIVLAAEYIRNISDRKAAEAALWKSEQQMRRITDNMLDIVSEADQEGLFRYLSPSHYTMLGFIPKELIGTSLYDLMHPEDLPRMREIFQVTLPQADTVRAEFRYRHAEGHYLWLETIGKCTSDEQTHTTGMIFASRDISERRKTEEALREANQTLQTTIQASPLAIIVLDNKGHIKLWNPAAEVLFGWSQAEVQGRFYPLVPSHLQEEFQQNLERVNLGETLTMVETQRQNKNGQLLDVSFSIAPLYNPNKRVDGFFCILADITEKKRAEAALKASEANYSAIFNAVNDAIFVLDIHSGAILDVNQKLCTMYGFSRSELLRLAIENVSSGNPPYTQANARNLIFSVIDGSTPLFEWQARKKSGELFWVEVSIKGATIGGHYRALAVVRDITERKCANAALKESEDRFRQIFEHNEDPAFLLYPRSLVIFHCNSAAVRLYGYSKETLCGNTLGLLMTQTDFKTFAEQLNGGHETEDSDTDWVHISPVSTRNSKDIGISSSFRGKIILSQGKPYVYCTLRNITEKLRIRRERRELQAQLLQTNKMAAIGTLASGIAHEINNPNNYILANAQFLQDMWHDLHTILQKSAANYGDFTLGGLPYQEALEDLPKLIEGLAEGSLRIKNIVSNLKDFARQEEAPAHQPLQINEVIQAALIIVANEIKKHTDHFFSNLTPNLPPILGQFQKIEQVIINLLINALQALPDRKSGVYLSTTIQKNPYGVMIKVRDQGGGISEENRGRIFDPFFTTRQKSGGTGLGLSICYALIKDHRGTIKCNSQVGAGTTVSVFLPALQEVVKLQLDAPYTRNLP